MASEQNYVVLAGKSITCTKRGILKTGDVVSKADGVDIERLKKRKIIGKAGEAPSPPAPPAPGAAKAGGAALAD